MASSSILIRFIFWCVAAWLATVMLLLVLAIAHPSVSFHWTTVLYLATTVIFSMFSFLAMGEDKRRARNGTRRVSEGVLHGLEFLGGWPGSLIAQQSLHHKNRKISYQVVYWFIVLANLLLVGWLVYLWFSTPDSRIPGDAAAATQTISDP